jgi:hypothetical protein
MINKNQEVGSNGKDSGFYTAGGGGVGILAGTTDIPNKLLSGFPQSLQARAETVHEIRQRPFQFEIHYSVIILSLGAIKNLCSLS